MGVLLCLGLFATGIRRHQWQKAYGIATSISAACRARLTVAAQRRIGPGRRGLLAAQGGGQGKSIKLHVYTQGQLKLLRLRIADQQVTMYDDLAVGQAEQYVIVNWRKGCLLEGVISLRSECEPN
jgi:hypothetical protein